MTNDHDPFDGYDPNREIHQRINQTLRQATTISDGQVTGPPIVTDWSEIDTMADVANSVRQTRNHDLRRLAGATVDAYHWFIKHHGESIEDGYAGPPFVLFGFDPRVAFSLSETTAEAIAARYLPASYRTCDVEADIHCHTNNATHVISVGYGEFVCLYKCCGVCKDWFSDYDRRYSENINFALPEPDSTHVAT